MLRKTSQQLAKEILAPSLRSQYVGKASQEVAVAATPKKLSFVERTVAAVALSVAIVAGGTFTVNTALPVYEDTTVEVGIAWGTDISTIEDAVRTVNPTATDKHIADAVDTFIHINNVSPHNIKAGTYKVPVIK